MHSKAEHFKNPGERVGVFSIEVEWKCKNSCFSNEEGWGNFQGNYFESGRRSSELSTGSSGGLADSSCWLKTEKDYLAFIVISSQELA